MKVAGVARVIGRSKCLVYSHLGAGRVNPKAYTKMRNGKRTLYKFDGAVVRALHRADALITSPSGVSRLDPELEALRYREPGVLCGIPRNELLSMAHQIVNAVKKSPYVQKQQEQVVKHVLKSIASVL